MGKVIFVTGASSGIGQAIANRFAEEGWHVVATARRKDRLQALEKQYPGKISSFVLDVSKKEDVKKVIDKVHLEGKQIDVLVNNAGLALGLDPVQIGNPEEWDQMVDVNIKGMLYMTRSVLPSMIQRNTGYIFNMGSIAGTYPYPGGNVYGATKAFVHQFTLNLKADLIGTGIRTTCIEPGIVETDFSLVRYRGDKKKADSVYAGAHALHAEDIANLIFTCTQQKEHVNINTIEVMPVSQASAPLAIHRNLEK